MDLGLHGRRALATGASRGIGAAIAKALAAEGVSVFAAARSEDTIRAWIAALPAEQAARITPLRCDLAELGEVEELAASLLKTGGVDILINNGGGPAPGAALGQSIDAWTGNFRTMAAHVFRLSDLLIPGVIERSWGRVITVASSGIEQPLANLALSNGVRSAVLGWSKTLASEVARHGVTVNVVMPGRIDTDRLTQLDTAAAKRQNKSVEDVRSETEQAIPIGRYGRPEELANVVAFLSSNAASYVTGSKIRIDGGLIRSV
jgi:3-oxoacyl-[acyl-carrier protein] reductase